MFAQIDRSLERSHGGLGIGLTLARRLIGMHGGTVVAHSEGLDRGSVIIVRLPVAGSIPENKPGPPGLSAASAAAPRHRVNVLVVDDNEDSAETSSMLLKLKGNEVRIARDGAEAVRIAASPHPDIIFLDIGLPKLNGCEAARVIRDMPWGRNVMLVALTGWGQQEDKRKSQEAGLDHHLVKPRDPAAVMTLIASVAAEQAEG